ncbi:MAG: pyruvate kinase [Desulfobacterales bacterium]|jgi:hypothetical protein
MDLWYELGESCELKEQPVTADGVLSRLEFLATNGFVKSEGGEWGYFRAKRSSCKSINVNRNCHMEQINSTRCKTKIIATIGPTSRSRPLLEQMINAGMNVARLNLSHGSYEDHGEVISTIRSLSKEMNKSVAIVLDLQGPKIRTGKLKDCNPFMLKRIATIWFTTKKVSGTCDLVSTTYANLVADVKKMKPCCLPTDRLNSKCSQRRKIRLPAK